MSIPKLLGSVDLATGAVRLERTLPVPPDQVWGALTDPDRLNAWLGPVVEGTPGPGHTFVLRMSASETATCTVTTWAPPNELCLTWDYTGEGPSELRFRLSESDGRTSMRVEHTRIPVDAVQYGAGWHVHLDQLAAHLSAEGRAPGGPDEHEFMAAYRLLEPHYAAAARAEHPPERARQEAG
jgi:uncharacterized protein YndB with AHSA1/START domain